jgi:hypothetical protein
MSLNMDEREVQGYKDELEMQGYNEVQRYMDEREVQGYMDELWRHMWLVPLSWPANRCVPSQYILLLLHEISCALHSAVSSRESIHCPPCSDVWILLNCYCFSLDCSCTAFAFSTWGGSELKIGHVLSLSTVSYTGAIRVFSLSNSCTSATQPRRDTLIYLDAWNAYIRVLQKYCANPLPKHCPYVLKHET